MEGTGTARVVSDFSENVIRRSSSFHIEAGLASTEIRSIDYPMRKTFCLAEKLKRLETLINPFVCETPLSLN